MRPPPTTPMTCAPRNQTRVAKCVRPACFRDGLATASLGHCLCETLHALADYCGLTPVNLLHMENYCWHKRSFGCKLWYGQWTLPSHMLYLWSSMLGEANLCRSQGCTSSFLYTLGRSLDNNKMPLEGPIPSDLNGNRNGGKEIVDRWVWFWVLIGFFWTPLSCVILKLH